MIRIEVPASSANLGPGFDTLGVALKLYNSMEFEFSDDFYINGKKTSPKNKSNLAFSSMILAFERMGFKCKGVNFSMKSQIPVSRGLGSSAACIIGGIQGAVELVRDSYRAKETWVKPMKKQTIYELATEIEGHPDNITPQLFGGITSSIMDKNHVYYEKIALKKGLVFCPIIPDFNLSTKEARSVLPDNIPYEDAVHNVGRTAFLIASLGSGKWDKLKISFDDKLHEPYRSNLIPDYDIIKEKAYENGALGFYLSGAGPTLMTIKHEDDRDYTNKMQAFLNGLENSWKIRELEIDHKGVRIYR